MSSGERTEEDNSIEQWKIKKLIKGLEAARGYIVFSFVVTLML